MKALEATIKLDIKNYRFDVLELEDGETMTEEQMKEAAYIPIIECLKALGEELGEDGTYDDGVNKASVKLEIL